jgi:ribonuclease T
LKTSELTREKYMKALNLATRFRGLLPVVVDVETSGLNPATDGLLELAAVTLTNSPEGRIQTTATLSYHVEPFHGAHLDEEALQITGIDPTCPLRFALPEAQALHRFFTAVRAELEKENCYRAVLVGHNAWFDLSFLLAAAKRSGIRHLPFHTFTTLDTASLSAVILGETVLARAVKKARISFDVAKAHSAIYDAEKTAELCCFLTNRVGEIGKK